MYFKPRIFISSTLKEKIDLRSEIEKLLKEVGAEPLLYESNLTPSIKLNTYRDDIKEADFIIFIIDEINGTPTSSGISGTMEEIKIAYEMRKPNHVYIKFCGKDGEMADIEEMMRKKGVSFYYYNNESELLEKIKSTIFTIARESLMANINEETFDFTKLLSMTYNRDYKHAIGYIAMHERMLEIWKTSQYDIYYSDLFAVSTEYAILQVFNSKMTFINPILEEQIKKIYGLANEFNNRHVNDFVTKGEMATSFSFPNYGNIGIRQLEICNPQSFDCDWYKQKFKEYDSEYDEFKKYASKMKLLIDTSTYND